MIQIVWEFVVKEEARGSFELAFGPGGGWGKLFARCPGFRGTTLLHDTNDPRHYLVVELWNTEVQRQQALSEYQAEYTKLETTMAEWTESRTELGAFRARVEATVRPIPPAESFGSRDVGHYFKRPAR